MKPRIAAHLRDMRARGILRDHAHVRRPGGIGFAWFMGMPLPAADPAPAKPERPAVTAAALRLVADAGEEADVA